MTFAPSRSWSFDAEKIFETFFDVSFKEKDLAYTHTSALTYSM